MDLWLTAGPGNAYPLVLRMLRGALRQPQPQQPAAASRPAQVRARAFDVLYNLSLHSAMMHGRDGGSTWVGGGRRDARQGRGQHLGRWGTP